MIRVLAALGILLCSMAAKAGTLNGPLISSVNWGRAFYAPGATPQATVTLTNNTGSAFAGTVTSALFNGRGLAQTSPAAQTVTALAAGASMSLTFSFAPPATNNRGYMVQFSAASGGAAVDAASGAFDVEADWSVFPRCGFISAASVGPSYNVSAVVAMLDSYRMSCIQWYDVNWKHHEPYSPASSWPNLANITIDRGILTTGLNAAHALGMLNFDYQLWNGAYQAYASDGSGVQLAWGMFTAACSPLCTSGQEDGYSDFPTSWATPGLLLMDPGNAAWRSWLTGQMRQLTAALPFDGVQNDTLGCPSTPRYTAAGTPIDQSQDLVPWTVAMGGATGKRQIINPVSGCPADGVANRGLDDIMLRAPVDAIYNEIHPEFGDTPYYPSLNGLAASVRQMTTKGAIIPAYIQQQKALTAGCHTVVVGGTICYFSPPGVKLLEAQMVASGLSHWQFGDFNTVCPVPQAKLISNIYVTGPQLCMDAPTQEWMQDAANFAVGYENLLRYGVTDAPETATITGATASAVGAAGAVYVMPKTKAGFQILQLLNLVAVPTILSSDANGTQPVPTPQANLGVKMYYFGSLGSGARLEWASPDVQHGAAQALSYSTGSDAGGNYVSFTLPSLAYYDMVWLETTGLADADYGLNPDVAVRGLQDVQASPGVWSAAPLLTNACCGRFARYEAVNFAAGASSVAISYQSSLAGKIELHLNSATGPLIASGVLPAVSGEATATLPVTGAAGTADLYLVFPDRKLAIDTFTFS